MFYILYYVLVVPFIYKIHKHHPWNSITYKYEYCMYNIYTRKLLYKLYFNIIICLSIHIFSVVIYENKLSEQYET